MIFFMRFGLPTGRQFSKTEPSFSKRDPKQRIHSLLFYEARVEATSEDSRYPIDSAFEEDGHGWRAVEVGEQTIQLVFDEPRRIQRIWLCFIEPDTERTQEFTLQWSTDQTDALRPLIQQQWNFSPTGSTIQIEDHEVNLYGVWMLHLIVRPEISAAQPSPL
jgi:hypothetical protein